MLCSAADGMGSAGETGFCKRLVDRECFWLACEAEDLENKETDSVNQMAITISPLLKRDGVNNKP